MTADRYVTLDQSKYPNIYAVAFMLSAEVHATGLHVDLSKPQLLDSMEQKIGLLTVAQISKYMNQEIGTPPSDELAEVHAFMLSIGVLEDEEDIDVDI